MGRACEKRGRGGRKMNEAGECGDKMSEIKDAS